VILNDSCPARQDLGNRAKPESIGGFSLASPAAASPHPAILARKKPFGAATGVSDADARAEDFLRRGSDGLNRLRRWSAVAARHYVRM
jgi:hypothetical protein